MLLVVGAFSWQVRALDPVEELQKQINELTHLRELSEAATDPLEEELENINSQLSGIRSQLAEADTQTVELTQDLADRENDLASQYSILSSRVRSYYKLSRSFSPVMLLLASSTASDLNRQLSYKSAVADEDKTMIINITSDIIGLEEDKIELEGRKKSLASLRASFEKEAAFFEGEIEGAKDYQAELSGKIASLTAQQQAILSEKSGTFQTTVGDVPLADDPNSRPDYNPGFSPAYAAFSFGAPHFKGMSQYGAFGRAKSGQNYQDILRAYYGGGIEIRDHDQNAQITVEGYGTYSLEEYAKRIYEMPGSWGDQGGMEALKAQAVAARSYALARGGSICATESCQVFKPQPKGGNWEAAVNATAGKVVYANGSPFSTWYASTSGGYQESYSGNGYSTPGFWDTPSGRSGWTSQAYEKTAGSPWFYKGWYKSRSGDSCGRSHPWLTSEEMADILNGWKVLFQGGGDTSRVTPQGSCWSGNPYSVGELQTIGGFTSVSSVSVNYSESGVTANVTFQTNKGSVTINGNDFYKAFNLRAPGRIALKSGLFNIERK
jgi:peptidoglycan hydrolase CwlO-like protein